MDALERIVEIKEEVEVITFPFEMGEDEARECGLNYRVIGSIKKGETTSEDTRKRPARWWTWGRSDSFLPVVMAPHENIYDAIGTAVPVIGIPAGVKIHSAVYATTPRNAGELTLMYPPGQIKEGTGKRKSWISMRMPFARDGYSQTIRLSESAS